MAIFYGSFGQNHAHRVNGFTWDCDVLAEIEANDKAEAHDKMFAAFGAKWAFIYEAENVKMEYFPRGAHVLKI